MQGFATFCFSVWYNVWDSEKRKFQAYMIANYHTHTYRCGHAEGHEREYAAQAAAKGLKILGFSDHTPYDFFDWGERNRPMRMKPEELGEYVSSVKSLAEKYRGIMEIHAGLEAEYYPKYFSRLLEMVRETGVEYMILGQHFLFNEIDDGYTGRPFFDEERLRQYVSQSVEGLRTGIFTYFAHPDLVNFRGDDGLYASEMKKIILAAKETDTPLEINMLGLRTGRNYPDERFWRLVSEEGNEVILGSDAHRPEDVYDRVTVEKAMEIVRKYDLNLIQTVKLKRP